MSSLIPVNLSEIYIPRTTTPHQEARLRVFRSLLGRDESKWACVRCGGKDSLEIDHIHDDRKADVARFGQWGYAAHIWYANSPSVARERLQVLCKQCNLKKRIYRKDGDATAPTAKNRPTARP